MLAIPYQTSIASPSHGRETCSSGLLSGSQWTMGVTRGAELVHPLRPARRAGIPPATFVANLSEDLSGAMENAPFTCVNAQFRPSWSRWPGKLKPSLSNAPRGPRWPSISGKWPTISGRDTAGRCERGAESSRDVNLPYITVHIGKCVVHLIYSALSSLSKAGVSHLAFGFSHQTCSSCLVTRLSRRVCGRYTAGCRCPFPSLPGCMRLPPYTPLRPASRPFRQ